MYPVSRKDEIVVMIEHLWCDFVASINVDTEYSFSDFSSNLSCLSFLLPL